MMEILNGWLNNLSTGTLYTYTGEKGIISTFGFWMYDPKIELWKPIKEKDIIETIPCDVNVYFFLEQLKKYTLNLDLYELLNSQRTVLPLKDNTNLDLKNGEVSTRTNKDFFTWSCQCDLESSPDPTFLYDFLNRMTNSDRKRERILQNFLGSSIACNGKTRRIFILKSRRAKIFLRFVERTLGYPCVVEANPNLVFGTEDQSNIDLERLKDSRILTIHNYDYKTLNRNKINHILSKKDSGCILIGTDVDINIQHNYLEKISYLKFNGSFEPSLDIFREIWETENEKALLKWIIDGIKVVVDPIKEDVPLFYDDYSSDSDLELDYESDNSCQDANYSYYDTEEEEEEEEEIELYHW